MTFGCPETEGGIPLSEKVSLSQCMGYCSETGWCNRVAWWDDGHVCMLFGFVEYGHSDSRCINAVKVRMAHDRFPSYPASWNMSHISKYLASRSKISQITSEKMLQVNYCLNIREGAYFWALNCKV